MTKKIIFSMFLLHLSAFCIFAMGEFDMQTEAEKREELEQYPIKVTSLSLLSTASHNFVFIDTDKIVLFKPLQLIEVNLLTNEQYPIVLPEECSGSEFMGFRAPWYDEETNSVHILFEWFFRELSPARRLTYHILHLEDYSWETIEELGDNLDDKYWYDSANRLLYIRENKFLLKFDLINREILEYIELPDSIYFIYCIYGNPLRILASTRSKNNLSSLHFFIYDVLTKKHTDFPDSVFTGGTDFPVLKYYTPFDEYYRFLGVSQRRANKSNITLMDFFSNTTEAVALVEFPYEIYNFKKIADGKYAFIVATRIWTGAHGPSFLCTLDYP